MENGWFSEVVVGSYAYGSIGCTFRKQWNYGGQDVGYIWSTVRYRKAYAHGIGLGSLFVVLIETHTRICTYLVLITRNKFC